MPTNIDKNVTRRCPDIKDDGGRQLEATLNEKNGGTIALRFVGLRSDPLEVPLRTLVRAAQLAAEGEDLNVQEGWEDVMVGMLSDFCEDVKALVDKVKADASAPAVAVDTNLDVPETGDEDLDDL